MPGRRTWVLGGALTALVVVVALVTWLLVRSDPYVAPAPSGTRAEAGPGRRRARAAAARGRRGRARRGPRRAAGAAPTTRGAGDLLAAVVDNADALQVEEFTARYVDDGRRGGPGRPLAGRGRHDLALRRLRRRAGARGGAGRLPDARRSGRSAITALRRRRPALAAVAHRPARGPAVRPVAGAGRRRAGRGRPGRRPCRRRRPGRARVLPQWPGRLVVEVPASEAALDAALAAEPGHLRRHRRGLGVRGRHPDPRLPGARLRQPGRSTTTSTRSAARW